MFKPAAPAPETEGMPMKDIAASPEGLMAPEAPMEEPMDDMGMADDGITDEEIAAHLDALPEEEKQFLAMHLTPEFVRAISLISGDQVGMYLQRFADPDKVLVPLPRQIAEKYLAGLSSQDGQSAPPEGPPQGPPPVPPQAAAPGPVQAGPVPAPAGAPVGGMMAPR